MGIHWNAVGETIIGGGILIIIGFLMWIWKRSIYGELETVKKLFMDFKKDDWEPFKEKVQLKDICGDNRQVCQLRLVEKVDAIKEAVDELKEDHTIFHGIKGTVQQLVHTIIGMNERIDRHINGK